jgi:hypothetical protein
MRQVGLEVIGFDLLPAEGLRGPLPVVDLVVHQSEAGVGGAEVRAHTRVVRPQLQRLLVSRHRPLNVCRPVK